MYGDQFGEFVCGYRGLRELQHRRRQRQRGNQKSNTFNKQNHHSARTTHHHCTTTSRNPLTGHFMEDVNTPQ